ncbi:MAG TPA: monovalent cation:proton antiporter family protein [Prolixibacteraceae bacterium]|nr:monovalent cation:proton antiporter family protein [Prolixibacteraceae bacterium]
MELAILQDIVLIFALSTLVNFVFTKIKVPTVVGYLLTGIIAGPHLLALVQHEHDIELMAEIGVVLLLFTIGMEFSLKHLMRIRRVVFFGGFLQVSLTAAVFYLVSRFYQLNWEAAIFIGFLAALSSTALVLKILQERSELTSNYGRTVVGILIFQDIMVVPLLLFTNVLGSENVNLTNELLILAIKAVFIIGLVYVGNKWLVPKLLHIIAMTKNQELFLMSIFLICLAVALLTSRLGMSLAFGAFLAGLMISESEYSHNAFGDLIPFKDTFTSFFFVSIGMLLDLTFIIDNYQLVILSVLLLLVIKTLIASGTGFILGHTFKGTILVGLALSQVGEFSFILAKIGFGYHVISSFYYQLFLAVAITTMSLTPFLIKLSLPIANQLLKLPLPNLIKNGLFPLKEVEIPTIKNHLVIIGKNSSALKLSKMAKCNNIPYVEIIFDPTIAHEKIKNGELVVYGDATNEPILRKAHVESADVVVISVGDLVPSMAIIDKIRRLNHSVYIIARVKHIDNVENLYKVGADQVLPENLEIAIDLFNRVLIKRLYPQKEINRIMARIRSMNLGSFSEKDSVNQPSILDELAHINITSIIVEKHSEIAGKTLAGSRLREFSGVTLLVIKRGKDLIEHPTPNTQLLVNDIAFVFGTPEQVNLATELFNGEANIE